MSRTNSCWKSTLLFTLLLGCLSGLLVLSGCSDDDPSGPTPTNETVGADGGEIAMGDDVTLDIPAGALPADVDFTMEVNASPASPGEQFSFVSDVVSIGPSGTQFATPAEITLGYEESQLKDGAESGAQIYTNDGTGWIPLETTVDAEANTATAEVDHLSDFAVLSQVSPVANGVYALLTVHRGIFSITGEVIRSDYIEARLDSAVAPCNPVVPVEADSVHCNDYSLVWDSDLPSYFYPENPLDMGEFIELGERYTFQVFGNDFAPDLTQAIDFPATDPYLSNVDPYEVFPLDGFEVTWEGAGTGTVHLVILPVNSIIPVVAVETANDGSYTFTANDLAGASNGTYGLVLNHFNMEYIDATGYDANSQIVAKVTSAMNITLGQAGAGVGPDGGAVLIGDEGILSIPAGSLNTQVEFTVEENTSATSTIDGWRLLTDVYTVGPEGQDFIIDALLTFDYSEVALGESDETTVTIFTDEGYGWTAMSSDVDENENEVSTSVSHLSDFAAMVRTPAGAEGVYAVLEMQRIVAVGTDISDFITARFDLVVDPDDSHTPLSAGDVQCGEWDLVWNSGAEEYEYWALQHGAPEFIVPGDNYAFEVTGSNDVPALQLAIDFPTDQPEITSPETGTEIESSGFELQWSGTGTGNVMIMITNILGEAIVDVETPNDGSYQVTADDLDGQSVYILVELIKENREAIEATGFDPNSFVRAYTYNAITLPIAQ